MFLWKLASQYVCIYAHASALKLLYICVIRIYYYHIVKFEWIHCPEILTPPLMYFDESKYCAWSYNTELAEVRACIHKFIVIKCIFVCAICVCAYVRM